jgi:16S rRNA U516 pseudouridylate synthase RsuA-like enzyme
VSKLVRVSIGRLSIGDLAIGHYRALTQAEVQHLSGSSEK